MVDHASQYDRRSRSDWEGLMLQYESSQVTQREFCARHNLAYSTFGLWRKRLRQTVVRAQPVSLIELPVQPAAPDAAWRVELDLGQGVVLRMK